MSKLSDKDRDRLVALLGMLGSDFDGERANAGMLANRLVRSRDLTWADVIVSGAVNPGNEHRQADPEPMSPAAKARYCLDSGIFWNTWELQFLQDILFRVRLSDKQSAVLERLYQGTQVRSNER